MDDNQICGVDQTSNGKYSSQGITMLCEAVKGSNITLRYRSFARIICIALLSSHATSLDHSVLGNPISTECGKKLAAVLPKTVINIYWGGSVVIELRGGLDVVLRLATLH